MGIIGIIFGIVLFFTALFLVSDVKIHSLGFFVVCGLFAVCIAMIVIDATAPVLEATKREMITTEFNGLKSEVPIVIEVTEYEYPWYSAFHERTSYKILGIYEQPR